MRGRPSAFLLAVLVLCVILPRSALAASALERVQRSGVLRWGGDIQGGEPNVYDDPKNPGTLIGFEVDLANAIARELGVKASFVQNDWSMLPSSLDRGTFDVILNGLEVTPTGVGRVRYTRPYYIFAERLMARKDDPRITDFASLEHRRVGTLSGSYAFELLRGHAEVVVYEGTEEPYIDLEKKRTDAVLLDDIIAARYGETKSSLRVVADVRVGFYAAAVRLTERELGDAIDVALRTITASGELERILRGAKLWSAREERLRSWGPLEQAAMLKDQALPPVATGDAGVADAGAAPALEPAKADVVVLEAQAGPRPMRAAQLVLFVKGAAMTLFVSTLAMAIASPLGLGLALGRRFGGKVVARLVHGYVEVYRGTPVLLQLYVLYYGVAPYVPLGAIRTNGYEPIFAAILGLGMNYAAYEAEVYRGAMNAVPPGQLEAATALGMPLRTALRRVLLPQAVRHALPNVTNDYIALLKDSSLVSVITVVELTKQMTITAVDLRSWFWPGAVTALLYFAMSYPLGALARRLEAKLDGADA